MVLSNLVPFFLGIFVEKSLPRNYSMRISFKAFFSFSVEESGISSKETVPG